MEQKTYPYKSGKFDIFGDEIWIFEEGAENDAPYSITFDSYAEYKKWVKENITMKNGGKQTTTMETKTDNPLIQSHNKEVKPDITFSNKELGILRDVLLVREVSARFNLEFIQSGGSDRYFFDNNISKAREIENAKKAIEEKKDDIKFLNEQKYPFDLTNKYDANKFLDDLNEIGKTKVGRDRMEYNIWSQEDWYNLYYKVEDWITDKYGLEMRDGGQIAPHKEVKANQNIAITEVLSKFPQFKDLKPMEAGMLFNLRDKDVQEELNYAKELKQAIYDSLIEKDYIYSENYHTITGRKNYTNSELTEKAKDFIQRVDNRLTTRRQVKSGIDLFPETSGIPELTMHNGGKSYDIKTISLDNGEKAQYEIAPATVTARNTTDLSATQNYYNSFGSKIFSSLEDSENAIKEQFNEYVNRKKENSVKDFNINRQIIFHVKDDELSRNYFIVMEQLKKSEGQHRHSVMKNGGKKNNTMKNSGKDTETKKLPDNIYWALDEISKKELTDTDFPVFRQPDDSFFLEGIDNDFIIEKSDTDVNKKLIWDYFDKHNIIYVTNEGMAGIGKEREKFPNRYLIYVVPKSKSFKPHVWVEGGLFMSKEKAENHAKQTRKMKDMYDAVEVVSITDKKAFPFNEIYNEIYRNKEAMNKRVMDAYELMASMGEKYISKVDPRYGKRRLNDAGGDPYTEIKQELFDVAGIVIDYKNGGKPSAREVSQMIFNVKNKMMTDLRNVIDEVAKVDIEKSRELYKIQKMISNDMPDYHDGGKPTSDKFHQSLIGKALWINSSANKYRPIIDINIISEDNVKVKTELSPTLTSEESYTLKELKDLNIGKKIRKGDVELITPKLHNGGKPTRDEYNQMLSRYDMLTGQYEDETDEIKKEELQKEIQELEGKINAYERSDEPAPASISFSTFLLFEYPQLNEKLLNGEMSPELKTQFENAYQHYNK